MSEVLSTTAGVLLAAGRGRRMGEPKQLLPWDGSTVVAAAFDALAGHCGAGMVVVLGQDADRVARALAEREFHRVMSDPDAEQLDSARLGLRRAGGIPEARRVLLHPADHPVIPGAVLTAMLRRAAESSRVLIPTWRGRGGHPVLIPAEVAAGIVSWKPTGAGLRAYWDLHPDAVQRLEFDDAPQIVMDLDSPEDYDAARGRPA
jgi:CTP:molybdopterin cytidylyltransferase MocA